MIHQENALITTSNRLKKQLFIALLIGVVCTWILFQVDQRAGENLIFTPPRFTKEFINPGFVVNTKGCRIHDLDAFDPSIQEYFFNQNLNCNPSSQKSLVEATEDELYIVDGHLKDYVNKSEFQNVKCCYRPFWRTIPSVVIKNKVKGDSYNPHRLANYCIYFSEPVKVLHEFVKVECYIGKKPLFKDYFTFVQKKEHKAINPNDQSKVNVLMIGLDSISRLNLYRQMPRTVQFLEDLGAIELLGYNKVAENTFPNLMPVLTGKTVDELKNHCWDQESVFDHCNFIWDLFYTEGYMTGYGEDSSDIGLFNYMKQGFKIQPTDYYLSAFDRVAENDIGHAKWLNTKICLGKRLTNDVLVAAIRSFVLNLKDILSFGFFWENSLTHDYLNLPKFCDLTYMNLLKEMKEKGILEKTIVVFMSDHGIRWGEFRKTYHGYLEERLPFLFILYPKWFQEKYPSAIYNLRQNQRKLTSPFDLHETLFDLVNLDSLKTEVIKIRAKLKKLPRGISLFLPIPEERTCKDAGISYNWCTCHQSTPESINNSRVINSVNAIVQHLNNLLIGFMQCSKLNVNKIMQARSEKVAISKSDSASKNQHVTDYTVTIETTPGLALFQATVRFTQQTNIYTVLAPVSRINTYGNQSSCITNYQLKLYCYCSNILW